MLEDLRSVLEAVPSTAHRPAYVDAVIEFNILAKPTIATRRLSSQRLAELYALDPLVPIFRVLRRLWAVDPASLPLVGLLCALARDPLLAATAPAIVPLTDGTELPRTALRETLRAAVGERLNESTLDKVARNAASSWSQSGHLEGRTFKRRRRVNTRPAAFAFALYLGHSAGFQGEACLRSGWVETLDCGPARAMKLALDAKRLGLIDLRVGGDVTEISPQRLDSGNAPELTEDQRTR